MHAQRIQHKEKRELVHHTQYVQEHKDQWLTTLELASEISGLTFFFFLLLSISLNELFGDFRDVQMTNNFFIKRKQNKL